MDEKTRNTVDKMKSTMTALAETQSTLAIGKAVIALIARVMLLQWNQSLTTVRLTTILDIKSFGSQLLLIFSTRYF